MPTGWVMKLSNYRFYMDLVALNRAKFEDFKIEGITTSDTATVFQQYKNTVTADYILTSELHEGWNKYRESTPAEFKAFKITGTFKEACNSIGEIQLYGETYYNSSTDSLTCPMKLTKTSTAGIDLTNSVTYVVADTPTVTSQITPAQLKPIGNETVTITGTGFSTNTADVSVKIDNVVCTVLTATLTEITCTSGRRTTIVVNKFDIMITGKGLAIGVALYKAIYINKWSDPETWGGEFPPVKGDTILIPKGQTLLWDEQSTPILNAIFVEGTLIVDRTVF
jgi:hypothetical protein